MEAQKTPELSSQTTKRPQRTHLQHPGTKPRNHGHSASHSHFRPTRNSGTQTSQGTSHVTSETPFNGVKKGEKRPDLKGTANVQTVHELNIPFNWVSKGERRPDFKGNGDLQWSLNRIPHLTGYTKNELIPTISPEF